jgi:hypothetical protein
MTDELQKPMPESQPENPPAVTGAVAPQLRKTNKKLWAILGIAFGVICLCSILCITLIATGTGKVMVEKAPIESVLDAFMKDMEAKDIESAYALFSPRAQRQVPMADLEKMIQGNNYILVEGYQSLSVRNINLTAAINANPDVPQGTVANVSGIISYDGGFTGQFTAILEKVDGVWKLDGINVTVPPDKFQP